MSYEECYLLNHEDFCPDLTLKLGQKTMFHPVPRAKLVGKNWSRAAAGTEPHLHTLSPNPTALAVRDQPLQGPSPRFLVTWEVASKAMDGAPNVSESSVALFQIPPKLHLPFQLQSKPSSSSAQVSLVRTTPLTPWKTHLMFILNSLSKMWEEHNKERRGRTRAEGMPLPRKECSYITVFKGSSR